LSGGDRQAQTGPNQRRQKRPEKSDRADLKAKPAPAQAEKFDKKESSDLAGQNQNRTQEQLKQDAANNFSIEIQ
jgi:hypothetical protein